MLLDELKLKQGQLSDYQFADKLSISHQLWQMTRTRKRDIGLVILKAVLKAYPELERDVLFFLHSDVVTPSTADNFTTPSETAQNRILGALRAFRGKFYLWFKSLKAR